MYHNNEQQPSTSSHPSHSNRRRQERARLLTASPCSLLSPSAIEHSRLEAIEHSRLEAIEHSRLEMAQRRAYPPPLQRAHRSFDGTELINSLDAVHRQQDQNNLFWPSTSYEQQEVQQRIPPHQQEAQHRIPPHQQQFNLNPTVLQQENEALRRDYEVAVQKLNSTMNSIRTFWSPELKRERQLRKEESARLASIQSCGSRRGMTEQGEDAVIQLENARCELLARERSMRQMVAALNAKDGASLSRMQELESRCAQLEAMLNREQSLRGSNADSAAFSVYSSKDARIVELEDELFRLRQLMSRGEQPRDYTEKTLSAQEMHTLQMKMERSEVELSTRRAELLACQGRLQAAQEQLEEMSKHLRLAKESGQARHQQNLLLTGDVEALRTKLETKNEALGQKKLNLDKLQSDLNHLNQSLAEKTDALKSSEQRQQQLNARLDTLESAVHDRDAQIERLKTRLAALPDVQAEKAAQARIEQLQTEVHRSQQETQQARQLAERDRQQQLESFRHEENDLRAQLDSLQKELSDRQVLLESQSEKIGDLNRELALCRMPSSNSMFNSSVNKKGTETNCEEMIELRGELAQARLEVDRLLKMMQSGEREKAQLLIQCKQLQNNLLQQDGSTSISARSTTEPGNYRSRVEELEEALRESVSITAERELHLAQQKQLNLQLNMQLMECRREMGELRSTTTNMGDKEALIRGMDTERRQHLDQLFQLKQEALMAAIGEKEAHIELLESTRGDRNENELDALRRHKLALMHKLQEENERRAQLQQQGTHHNSDLFRSTTTTTTSNVNRPGPSSSSILTTSGMAQDDDADGIWA